MRMVPGALACALLVISCGGDELLLPAEGEPATLAIVHGDAQTGPVGGQLAEPLVVRVTDTRGRPVAGTNVAFAPAVGSVAPEATTTDADGLAATQWSLGMQTGEQALDASVAGASPPLAVRFTATASAGAARGLIIVSGNGQSATAGSTLPAPLVVRLLDGSGNPISGGAVAWVIGQGGGRVDPATSTTAADGTTSASWTLGPALGANTLSAVVSGVGTVEFAATATVGAASRLAIVTQPSSTASSGVPFAQQPVIELRDASGNAVPQARVDVTVAIASGGGTLGGATTRATDGGGRAAFTDLSITGSPGTRTLVFAANGFSVTSSPIQVGPGAPSPSESRLSADPTSFEAGSGSSTITVTVRDGQGTPLPGVPVQLTVSGSGNAVTQPGSTNSSGVATGSFTSTVAESKTVSATAAGVQIQQTATVTVTAPPLPPTADASQTTAQVPNGVAGTATVITVQTRDVTGAAMTTGGAFIAVSVTGANNPGGLAVTDNGNGTYTASYTPLLTGVDQVDIRLGGTPIGGSPYTSTVVAPST